jgi:hypothetical protein
MSIMNEPLNPEHVKNLAAGFVVGDLTPEEAAEFRQLLIQHPDLSNDVEDLQETLWQVLDEFTEVEAPTHLLPTLLQLAESSVKQPVAEKWRSRGWGRFVVGIAALLVVILGVDYYRLRQRLNLVIADNQRLRQEFAQAQVVKTLLQEPQTRLFTFKAVNSDDGASGGIIMNPEQQKVLMFVQNLSAPPSGHVYVLWTVVASEKVFCGEIKPYTWGNASYALPFTPEMYRDFYNPKFSGLVVTLETNPTVSRPTGPIVMQSS